MLFNLPPELRAIIWGHVLERNAEPVVIFSQPKNRQSDKTVNSILLLNRQGRKEVKPIFYGNTTFEVGNTARRADQQPNIQSFNRWVRCLPAADRLLITKITIDVELVEAASKQPPKIYNHDFENNISRGRVRTRSFVDLCDSLHDDFLNLQHIECRTYHEEKSPVGNGAILSTSHNWVAMRYFLRTIVSQVALRTSGTTHVTFSVSSPDGIEEFGSRGVVSFEQCLDGCLQRTFGVCE